MSSQQHMQINPRLISMLAGEDVATIKNKPTLTMLPGVYGKLIHKHKRHIQKKYPENEHYLRCTHCNRKGKYDLQLVLVNNKNILEAEGNPDAREVMDWIQPTGYFRCKHCNSAGQWVNDNPVFPFELMGAVKKSSEGESRPGYYVGSHQLYDGTIPHWATDSEEHYLNKIEEGKDEAYVWNRLGNMYYSGGRPELSAAAHEHAIRLDPAQIESHFSIANLLAEMGEWTKASDHYRRMLIYAHAYTRLTPEKFRNMLANGLSESLKMYADSEGRVQFLPDGEENKEALQAAGLNQNNPNELIFHEMDLHPDDIESFYPLAEMYMGDQRMAISRRKRTLKLPRKKMKKA
ncbi:hypothetical protein HUG20_04600 [Salicibibacter cibi]|uniref:Tetratricopeptide repeat protein n=1 Tax=Salicibibacter cibi TaxID=2743001 RepID=A0A7T6Z998_9BACI|nr:hypothetical protein [Salicibibacter cibi]QQK79238.1 hypothetical protein HUG20_04600 [Salicibibacter cibi]